MIIASSNNIQEVVDRLNEFLVDGLLKYRGQLTGYYTQKTQPDFNEAVYIEVTAKLSDEWFNSVSAYLESNVSDKHHLFHFLQHHRESLIINSMPSSLSNILISFEYNLYALEDIILRLEEKGNVILRKEIAEKEYKSDIIYEITYSDHSREIKLNNIVIKKPDFNSENDNCFQYIYKNPNRPIGYKELEEASGSKLNKRLAHIVRDLGFTHELKDVFFPVVTKDQIKFVNPITKQYSYKNELPPINFNKIGRKSEKE